MCGRAPCTTPHAGTAPAGGRAETGKTGGRVKDEDKLRKIASADLNLLLVAAVLLKTRNVSRSAEILASSQPTVSRSLAKIRAHFNDHLLIRSANGMLPTTFGRTIEPQLMDLMDEIHELMILKDGSGAAAEPREVRVGCSEYVQYAITEDFMRIQEKYQELRFSFYPMPPSIMANGDLSEGKLDIMIGTHADRFSGLRSMFLYDEDFVILKHKSITTITLDDFLGLPHIDVSPTGSGHFGEIFDKIASAHRVKRRVAVQISSYTAAPGLVKRLGLICVIPQGIASRIHYPDDVDYCKPDFDFPKLPINMYWHNVNNGDSSLQKIKNHLARKYAVRQGHASLL